MQNGDFETYTTPPWWSPGNIDPVSFWTNPDYATPDYFNSCITNNYQSVPQNFCGYQYAHSDSGYVGIVVWYGNIQNYREYIENTLSSPLSAGTCYHFQMYVSLGNNGSYYNSNTIGVYFSDTLIQGFNYDLNLDTFYQPQLDTILLSLPDTGSAWMMASGDYTASGGESYIMIGNFRNDSNSNLISTNQWSANACYFYIDDVSLTPCSTVGINKNISNNNLSVFPNPATGAFAITTDAIIKKGVLHVFNVFGEEVYSKEFNGKQQTVNYNLSAGVYFVKVVDDLKEFVGKVVVK